MYFYLKECKKNLQAWQENTIFAALQHKPSKLNNQ